MQALNQKERKKSIIRFVLFFTALVILIILLMWNLCCFKGELSDRQRMMLMRYNNYLKAEKEFVNKIHELDSLVTYLPESQTLELDAAEIAKANNFSSITEKDSSFSGLTEKFSELVTNYLKLKVKFLKESGGSEKLEKQIQELQSEIKDKDSEIQKYELLLMTKG